ncbi:4-(cytidine 5'-diphospho)-2-C-methyl-D-erythritol kinase [Oceanobacillus massiliensis]|uniref:4-(cytidine 5'-diphospho)-2-C-methyl-D-erythritol kinase n=1 Tax=Oceanobacillus massiliensis TaxID=1465765 RepID=UPI003015E454
MTILEKAPAKINLSLNVLSKRDDDYHDVEMIMTSIDLADRIELERLQDDRIEISLESRYVPNDERNLAYKAAKAFKTKYGITEGVHITIDKNIPVSAGLGGGSSDAAAVLRGLNKLWSKDIPLNELAELGSSIGADVAYCVYGKTAIARGFGEKIEKLSSPPPCWIILAKPDIGVSSRTIFSQINIEELFHPDTAAILEALEDKNFSKLCNHIGNSLEPITFAMHPEVQHIKEAMTHAGAAGVLMSGSGPTVYGLVEQQSKATRIYNGMRGFCEEVYLVRLIG